MCVTGVGDSRSLTPALLLMRPYHSGGGGRCFHTKTISPWCAQTCPSMIISACTLKLPNQQNTKDSSNLRAGQHWLWWIIYAFNTASSLKRQMEGTVDMSARLSEFLSFVEYFTPSDVISYESGTPCSTLFKWEELFKEKESYLNDLWPFPGMEEP